ncbi:unnamed protein product [Auanema sp. JU1783]|nr:unnamed protein product [Auanema sp. JU1783]
MKRSSDGKRKDSSSMGKDLFGREIPSSGFWSSEDNETLLIFTSKNLENRKKIAAFDMDGTLITTKSGKVFPVDTNDWKLLDSKIPKKLAELYNDGYKICIFTNQKGLEKGHVLKKDFQKKIEAVVKALGVPIHVFISAGSGRFRKPCTGMWEALERYNDDVKIDKEESLFVGDAAGRIVTKTRPKKDHSSADRLLAINLGLKFFTPEQFFFEKKEEPWKTPAFVPTEFIAKKLPLLEPEHAKVPSQDKELILMVGFPGSGKSTFARNIAAEHNYAIVSRDILGTWQKCVAQAKKELEDGRSVIIDNTNPDVESRARYVSLAKTMSVSVRCFVMNCTMDHALHNIRFRTLTNSSVPIVSSMVLRMHNSKYKKPELSEGFDEIVSVNFVADFSNDEHERLYSMHLIE